MLFVLAAISLTPWMKIENTEIEPLVSISAERADACTQVLIQEINHRFHLQLTSDNAQAIQMPNWPHSEKGFLRGGGFNIRVVADVPVKGTEARPIVTGRFSGLKSWLRLGASPSLHIPERIGETTVFLKTLTPEQVHYDFIAHLDSGYAYLPAGLILHLLRDVIGAKTRPPCPVSDE